MLRKLGALGLTLVLLGPAAGLIGVGLVMNPALASCSTPISPVQLGNVPGALTATAMDGTRVTLNKSQLGHAATIITTGASIQGVGREGIKVALMAALTESGLRMLSNTTAYPESAAFPHDGDGADHDSLGLFQMRPAAGWGTVAELMNPEYQARAFFGGPAGPNHGSPRGLLDIPDWQHLDPGQEAQAVEVSAFPGRYRANEPIADAILTAFTHTPAATSAEHTSGPSTPQPTGTATPTSSVERVVFPLPEGSWVASSPFGPRINPVTGEPAFHTGQDYAAPNGTPIFAAADGIVTVAEYSQQWGGLIVIEHHVDGSKVATAYAHMWQHGIDVHAGDQVRAGRRIGEVGSSGMSTGPHLHFEVRPGGTHGAPIDPAPWLNTHHSTSLSQAVANEGTAACAVDGARTSEPVPVSTSPSATPPQTVLGGGR